MDPRATSTNKAKCRADENSNAEPKQSPVSENAAMERHANTKRDEEDLPCTKDLTRGTEDVHNGNVRHTQDPHTSPEASVEGTSAKCAEMTPVILESTLPHEMQTELQDSLPLTPRLPTDGEPSRCKQEVAESIMMAGCTNWTVEMAEPMDADADVDRMALLGGKPAERASGVDEGNEMERGCQTRLQQIEFYCEEKHQRDENTQENLPSTYGLPLEGEWTACASSGLENSRESTDGPSESREAEDTAEIESEGCNGGMSERGSVDVLETLVECCQQLPAADGDADQEGEPMSMSNEAETLVIMSIESEGPDDGGIPCVHLQGTNWHAGDTNSSGNRADRLRGEMEVLRGWMDALITSNRPETAYMSCGDSAGMYLGAGCVKRSVKETDGIGSRVDTSDGSTDVPSVETDANKPANATENVSTSPKRKKLPDSPVEAAKQHSEEPNGSRDHADVSSICRDMHSIGNERETAVNETEHACQNMSKRLKDMKLT